MYFTRQGNVRSRYVVADLHYVVAERYFSGIGSTYVGIPAPCLCRTVLSQALINKSYICVCYSRENTSI